ncbi:unnamed protein product [Vicia faba]|uniref:Uncharacterized protein n=1 Tax=Vicia faba TaxID=3906 RepID=A0AAV0YH48_VICFA|nr:unnamed protein product [Vicia faba]
MFSIKDCNKGTSFYYVSMIFKILKHFNIGIPNLQYRSPSMALEFSQCTLTNMGYFWDKDRHLYYFCVSKNGKKICNFDDPVEFVDVVTEPHMIDDQLIDTPHGAPQVDADVQDVEQGLVKVRRDERYEEDCRRRDAFEAAQEERFRLLHKHMTTQDTNFEAFASYVSEKLLSERNEMDVNHASTNARINHMISSQNENHYHYAQFYREMCNFLDHHFRNEGYGWYHGVRSMPRGRGGR